MAVLWLLTLFVKHFEWVYMNYPQDSCNSQRGYQNDHSYRIFLLVESGTTRRRVPKCQDVNREEILRKLECSFGGSDYECPINGEWSPWGEWEECLGECGQVGVRQRFRKCNNPSPLFGGEVCVGPRRSTTECRMPGCTEEEYKELIECDPFRTSEFNVLKIYHKNYPALIERCLLAECHYIVVKNILQNKTTRYWNALHCVKHSNGCPVPGGWSNWGKWSECSAHTGIGKKIRCRTCDSPIPTFLKMNCKGANCTMEPCQNSQYKEPPHGEWENWSPWSKCTVSCGQGLRERVRTCSIYEEPEPLRFISTGTGQPWMKRKYCCPERFKRNTHHHSVCSGPHTEIEPCFLIPCPVNGGWSEWEPWTQCSTACGVGVQSRSRACSSPPPSGGGLECYGPYTWIKHCYLEPCSVSRMEATVFSGEGALHYRKTGHPTRLLHIFLEIKPLGMNGDILIRSSTSRPLSRVHVRLSLAAGYLVFLASSGSCHVMLISSRPIKMYTWLKVQIMVTTYGAQMRLDSSENYLKKAFSCSPKLPDFDSEMEVGGNFTGHISKLYINFVRRELKLFPGVISENKFIYPSGIVNVVFENIELSEGRSLEDLILVPCGSTVIFSIELVVKTASQDGLLMLISDTYANKYLILSFEPKRVILRMEINDCIHECFQTVETHVGRWTHIAINFDKDKTWGLAVNGGLRKIIKNRNTNYLISCLDHIMIGDIEEMIYKLKNTNNMVLMNEINIRKISGILGYIKVNKKIVEVNNLPALVAKGNTPLSSEATSTTRQYEEIEIIYGQQLNLTCYYKTYHDTKMNIFSSLYGDENEPLWIKFDTPLIPNDTELMENMGIIYQILDNSQITMLKILSYSSREAVEGFYSCWIPSLINGSIILTYGITVIDIKVEFTNSSTLILQIVSFLLLIIYLSAITWLIFEYERSYNTRDGLFSSGSVVKELYIPQVCEISHEYSLRYILNVRSRIKKRRRKRRIRLRRIKK